eukprot:744751_1
MGLQDELVDLDASDIESSGSAGFSVPNEEQEPVESNERTARVFTRRRTLVENAIADGDRTRASSLLTHYASLLDSSVSNLDREFVRSMDKWVGRVENTVAVMPPAVAKRKSLASSEMRLSEPRRDAVKDVQDCLKLGQMVTSFRKSLQIHEPRNRIESLCSNLSSLLDELKHRHAKDPRFIELFQLTERMIKQFIEGDYSDAGSTHISESDMSDVPPNTLGSPQSDAKRLSEKPNLWVDVDASENDDLSVSERSFRSQLSISDISDANLESPSGSEVSDVSLEELKPRWSCDLDSRLPVVLDKAPICVPSVKQSTVKVFGPVPGSEASSQPDTDIKSNQLISERLLLILDADDTQFESDGGSENVISPKLLSPSQRSEVKSEGSIFNEPAQELTVVPLKSPKYVSVATNT